MKFILVTSPAMSLRSVDFPAPFGPTRANLVSKSIPNSKSLYIQGVDSLYRKLTFWTIMTGGGMVPQLQSVILFQILVSKLHVLVKSLHLLIR